MSRYASVYVYIKLVIALIVAFVLEVFGQMPSIPLDQSLLSLCALVLQVIGVVMIARALFIFPLRERKKGYCTRGIYAKIRYPIVSGVVFFLYPSVGLTFGSGALLFSWIYVLVSSPFIIWILDKTYEKEFGHVFGEYVEKTKGLLWGIL